MVAVTAAELAVVAGSGALILSSVQRAGVRARVEATEDLVASRQIDVVCGWVDERDGRVAEGTLSPLEAFGRGAMRVRGDVRVARQLARLLTRG